MRLLVIGGVIAIALALFLFVSEQGLQYGMVYWGVSGIVCSFIVIFFLTGSADGIRSILAVLAFAVAFQGFQVVAVRRAQVIQTPRLMQQQQFPPRHALNLRRQPPRRFVIEQLFRFMAGKAAYHVRKS